MALLSDVILRGTRGSQPAATAVPEGTLYCVTNESNILERSSGSAWESYSPIALPASAGTPPVFFYNEGYDEPIIPYTPPAGAGGGGGAPTDATYLVEDANGSLSAEVVTGTTYLTTAAYASRQAAAKSGRLFLPSDGFVIERDTGSAWAPWGPIFPMTAPVSGDFSWVNQGSASVTTTNGGISLSVPANAGGGLRARVKAAPATPYTITAFFILRCFMNYGAGGLLFREAGTGELETLTKANPNSDYQVNRWTSATVFSSTPTTITQGTLSMGAYYWQRIADDGANRIHSVSWDGITWNVVATYARTTFLTADEVGFCVFDNSTHNTGITLLSWKEA